MLESCKRNLSLNELCLGGRDISGFALRCETGLEEPLSYIKALIRDKYAAELLSEGAHCIYLTTSGSQDGVICAQMEGKDLIIRAINEEQMKKAVVCFWYENIGNTAGKLELSAEFRYSRDLSQTVFYSDFCADRTGSTCCMEQLAEAHTYANSHGYKVFADYGAKYYIGRTMREAVIKTDTEWGNAQFIIDDSQVTPAEKNSWAFRIEGISGTYTTDAITCVSREQTNLGITLPQKSIVTIWDEQTRHYIRYGGNADNGQAKLDSVVVDRDGSIDMDAPLMWDFDRISSVTVRPIDETVQTVSGGIFTTVANQAPSEYTYYCRGILICRSNTVLNGVTHYITGEGDHGAPYKGFVYAQDCAYVTVQNCTFTAHKTYQSPTTAMGTYDIGMQSVICAAFKNCDQTNDIQDRVYWGISGTNYCKNFVYDRCVLSRFDAHKGVANAAIRNSVIGYAGATIVGYGTFTAENSTFFSPKVVELREDFGSSWEGKIIIRNCTVSPEAESDIHLIVGKNLCMHDFGYPCFMPQEVMVENITVRNAQKAYVFSDLNPDHKTTDYVPEYPYIPTETVLVRGFAGVPEDQLHLSPNSLLFKNTSFFAEE